MNFNSTVAWKAALNTNEISNGKKMKKEEDRRRRKQVEYKTKESNESSLSLCWAQQCWEGDQLSRLNLRFCSPVHNTVRATRKSQEEEKEEKEEEETVAAESGSRSDSQTPNTAMTF